MVITYVLAEIVDSSSYSTRFGGICKQNNSSSRMEIWENN